MEKEDILVVVVLEVLRVEVVEVVEPQLDSQQACPTLTVVGTGRQQLGWGAAAGVDALEAEA